MGGSNDVNNLVDLTAREHFVCHWLLIRIYPENIKLAYAFSLMWGSSNRLRKHIPSSRAYRECKEHLSGLRKGVVFSEEHRRKLSEAKRGKKQSPELVEKRAAAHRGKKRPPRSEQWRRRQSEVRKGRVMPEEARRKIGLYWRGRKRGAEFGRKVSEARKGSKLSEKQKENMSGANNHGARGVLDLRTGKRYDTILECRRDLGLWYGQVCRAVDKGLLKFISK